MKPEFLLNVRRYESRDLKEVIETYTASIHSLAAPHYSPEQLAAWAPVPQDETRWRARLDSLHTIVAQAEGSIAGFASHTESGYLDFLFTHPGFARRGIATALYCRIESLLMAAGVPVITTHSSLAARAFFDHHGFQLDGEECVECRGAYLRRFAMHKELFYHDVG
ncbi:MAG TPA: GNAT family N-acetyltransferase [Verrucomicrobiae bacterium]|jgi:putative acetyltransferase|nr:GNAT family N-acetyltransferase [Verrucomicrobiae bacterium]